MAPISPISRIYKNKWENINPAIALGRFFEKSTSSMRSRERLAIIDSDLCIMDQSNRSNRLDIQGVSGPGGRESSVTELGA